MVSLSQFYSNKANMAAILPYINGNGAISLRMIDWFVTNYVKMNNVILPQPGGRFINVSVSYRTQLKAYSKQQFDPFRRRDRVAFHYEPDQSVETTVGQLNFFRWMLQHRILQYVQENVEAIERAMMDHDDLGKGGSGCGSGCGSGSGSGKEEAHDERVSKPEQPQVEKKQKQKQKQKQKKRKRKLKIEQKQRKKQIIKAKAKAKAEAKSKAEAKAKQKQII
jgi:hypothetical protein